VNATAGRRLLYSSPFLGLLGTYFVLGLTSAFIAPFGSLWATQEIGMSSQMLGLFMTINSLSAILISTFIGRWSDSHLTRRSLLCVGACGGALAKVGYAFVRDPIGLTLIGSSALALASMNFAQLFAHVLEELGRPEHAGADAPFLMGVLRAFYALAWMVGPLLGAWIKGQLGYRSWRSSRSESGMAARRAGRPITWSPNSRSAAARSCARTFCSPHNRTQRPAAPLEVPISDCGLKEGCRMLDTGCSM
jgi:MFS family permease